MSALVIVTDSSPELRTHISKYFNDFTLLELTAKNKSEYYSEVHKALDALRRPYDQIFLVATTGGAFHALLAAKLVLDAHVTKFHVAEWIGKRFKILRVP